MTDNHVCRLGFRILGSCANERKLVDWQAAFAAHASLDHRANVHLESYLSAFSLGADFEQYLDAHRSTKGFDGICGGDYIWFDIDRDDLEIARFHTARLASRLVERFSLCDEDLLLFFSGSKGFHIGLPTALWEPLPSLLFNKVTRHFAEGLAAGANVVIDTAIYDKVRAFRAPNSRHATSGFHKRHLSQRELIHLSVERIRALAAAPQEFDIPEPTTGNSQASADWQAAELAVDAERAAVLERIAIGKRSINRSTLDFIRNGADTGNRHRRLFLAAANLAEFGCPADLAQQLLTDSARDSGLSPSDTQRQIDCGLNYKNTIKGNS